MFKVYGNNTNRMKRAFRILPVILVLLSMSAAQTTRSRTTEDQEPLRPFPGGKDLRDEALKADHEKSIKEAEELIRLSQELKEDLEKNTRHVLSLAAIKKTEEIEKISKRIRTRMRK